MDVNEVVVNIINDDIREDTETFFGSIDGQGQPVITNPDLAVVRINDDNDGKFNFLILYYIYGLNCIVDFHL